jgi:hypothetical protein
MKSHPLAMRRLRAILDVLLILLLALALSGREDRAQAQARYQARQARAAGLERASLPGDLAQEAALAAPAAPPAAVELDNNTLAAMIAAENATLVEAQFSLDLPLVQH